MPRYLYSAAAMVVAFFMVARHPVGEGLSHRKAYARQGMYRRLKWDDDPTYRWRSLGRWARKAGQWWPAWSGGGMGSLLVLWLQRSGGQGLQAAVQVALDGHVRWGRTM
jgi:hypothetical protein